MYSELFDTSLLPLSNDQYTGTKRLIDTDIQFLLPPKTHYDQFVTNGYEFVFLTIQSVDAGGMDILKQNGFKCIKRYNSEPCYFGFRPTRLDNNYKNKHSIVMCVYFLQNPNNQIEKFLDYYTSQGVEKIFMYYCGKLSDRPNLPQRENVEYFEWDYIHYVHNFQKQITQHYSQVPLYNIFSKKIAPHCDWSIYCDIDEFIKVANKKQTIKDYLYNSKIDNHIYLNEYKCYIDFKNKKILYDVLEKNETFGKTILNSNHIHKESYAENHRMMNASTDENLKMFHFRHFVLEGKSINLFNSCYIDL
jgi:hypothetical protein